MLGLILLLLLFFLLFGFGFGVHVLWVLAFIALVAIIVSALTRSGGRRGRWW